MEHQDWKQIWQQQQERYLLNFIHKYEKSDQYTGDDIITLEAMKRHWPDSLPDDVDMKSFIVNGFCHYCSTYAFHENLTACEKLGTDRHKWINELAAKHNNITSDQLVLMLKTNVGTYQKIISYSSSSGFMRPRFEHYWNRAKFEEDVVLFSELLEFESLDDLLRMYGSKCGKITYDCGSYEGHRQTYSKFDARYLYQHITKKKIVPDPIGSGYCAHCKQYAYHYELSECRAIGKFVDEWVSDLSTKYSLITPRQIMELIRDQFGRYQKTGGRDRWNDIVLKTYWDKEHLEEELLILNRLMQSPYNKDFVSLMKLYNSQIGKELIQYDIETGNPKCYYIFGMSHLEKYLQSQL